MDTQRCGTYETMALIRGNMVIPATKNKKNKHVVSSFKLLMMLQWLFYDFPFHTITTVRSRLTIYVFKVRRY